MSYLETAFLKCLHFAIPTSIAFNEHDGDGVRASCCVLAMAID